MCGSTEYGECLEGGRESEGWIGCAHRLPRRRCAAVTGFAFASRGRAPLPAARGQLWLPVGPETCLGHPERMVKGQRRFQGCGPAAK
jgi:hypothetical protein